MNALKLYYFFDPLCGWCYASAPALAGLALNIPSYERGVARVLGYDLPP